MTEANSTVRRKRSALEVLHELRQPKVAVMLALGFSSGLPFLLTANTFGYWLRDEGTSLIAIGFISWVGFAYAFKVYWSPLVDRIDVPLLGRLGRRRGWMLLCQILVTIGLLGMAAVGTAAMPSSPMVTRIWHSSIQPRRRPRRPSSGTSMRSTSGDQYTLKAYAKPTQEMNPMATRLVPESLSQ